MTSVEADVDNPATSLEVLIIHNSRKHPITLLSDSQHHMFVVEELSNHVEKHLDIPVQSQKLIHKGKTLTDMASTLSSNGIANGSKIMLIGRKFNVEEDPNYKRLRKIDDSVDVLEKQLENLIVDFDGVKQGFLKEELAKESVKKFLKKAKGIIEEYVKKLEIVDSFNLDEILRKRRKNLVHKIQSIIDKGDQFVEALQQYLVNGGED